MSEPLLTVAEREMRIIEVLLALSCASDSGFDASYESIGEMAAIKPYYVQNLCWSLKAYDTSVNRFLEIKAIEKGVHGTDKKAIRRFRMNYPDRDARWHVTMRSLSFYVWRFAMARGMLDNSPEEIERAYNESQRAAALVFETKSNPRSAAEAGTAGQLRDDDEIDSDQPPYRTSEIIERLDRIERLLRQLVKARAFQECFVPFEEEDG